MAHGVNVGYRSDKVRHLVDIAKRQPLRFYPAHLREGISMHTSKVLIATIRLV